ATLIESGLDYDESVDIARDVERRTGARLIHSTDDRLVIAGAATMTLAMLRQCETPLDALVLSIGGGSQAVGALTVSRHLQPTLEIFGVQAAQAPTICDSWRARAVLPGRLAETFADGLATRNVYEMTFGTLVEGLADFVTVSDAEIAAAIRALLRTTHNLAEGAGAAGLAGLIKLRERLAGRTVGIVLSGSNIDEATLRQVVTGAY
ncbi:MAG: pyridoxal-phosphate dependent enzyme, partial [Candidatus Schekmanbacteria bacterium]|nr:pyridoxal-phosphate dependent enzyme [Candidatus Schekmanbacteria bacterium]